MMKDFKTARDAMKRKKNRNKRNQIDDARAAKIMRNSIISMKTLGCRGLNIYSLAYSKIMLIFTAICIKIVSDAVKKSLMIQN